MQPSEETMKSVWVIDDDKSIRWVFEKALTRESIEYKSFASAQDALTALNSSVPQVVVSDIRMPGASGLDLLQRIKAEHPEVPVIVMTAYSDLESAVAAFQGGAFEYLPKPFDVNHAVELIRRAIDESVRQTESTEETTSTPEILGQAPSMQEVFRAIGRLSQSHATVLITGESGSGKELVARALHRHSPRSTKPFIAINTAAIPKDLLESELFGHERGSFTGAQAMRRGRFEQADAGTLFLGGHQPIKANVRVIAATHQDLEQRVKQGLFREDLYHRLNVIRLRLPPMRERREDIPLLARFFLLKSARELGVEPKRLSEAALRHLSAQDLPGNVRQLENLCHWLSVMAPGMNVEVNDLPPELRGETTASAEQNWLLALEREVEQSFGRGEQGIIDQLSRDFERTLIVKALQHTGGRRIEAATLLGLGRNTLTRKIQELGLEEKAPAAG